MATVTNGERVFEPFSGSGSQIVGAESIRRRCFAVELKPQYCDVGVVRWQALTGRSATLDADGRTFDEIAAERLNTPRA